jgi:phospholipid/cholesterol/gamma-HCH transport system substrate-binding protein
VAELEIKPTAGQQLRVLAVLVSATLLTAFLMLLFVGGGGDLLARRTTITTYMPDATGVGGESIVRLGGIPIGKVSRFALSGRLDRQNAVSVEMRVVTRYLKNIPEDSQANIGTDTLVGYPFIDISPGKSRVSLKEHGFLRSEPAQQADIRADQLRAISTTFKQIDDLLATVISHDTEIGKFVNGSEVYDYLETRVGNFDRGLHSFITPQSPVGQAFYSAQAYDDIRRVILDADKALASIQSGEGAAGHLFLSNEQYDAALRTLTDLHAALGDLNAGKGAFGALLHDDQSYENVRAQLARIDAQLAPLNTAELLHSPQLYESLNGALRELDALLRDYRRNPKKFVRYKIF